MIYAITSSAEYSGGAVVPSIPVRPEIARDSPIDDWELISTTWQITSLKQTSMHVSACSGRMVWTWKAIYSAVQPSADRIP